MFWQSLPSKPPLFLILLFIIIFATYIWQQISSNFDLRAEVQMKDAAKYPELKPHYEELEKMAQQNPVVNISGIVPPFHRLEEIILVTPKYRLATCQIEKIMSTVRDGIFCYLTNTTEFLAHNRTISTEYWTTRFCDNQFVYHDLDKAMEDYNNNLTLFSVIRHPIDRFLSGYVDKCINEQEYYKGEKRCFGCKQDMKCFVEKLHRNLFEYYTNTTKNSSVTYYYVRHFAPQTWYCNFKEHKNDYIFVDYHTGPKGIQMTAKEFDRIFEEVQVPADMRALIQSEMLSDQENQLRTNYGYLFPTPQDKDSLTLNTTKNSSITYYYVRHFAPQTWYCNFKDHKNDYILVDYHTGPKGIEMTAKEFDKIFEQVQVPADMRAVIQSEMLKGTTKHSTVHSETRRKVQQQLLSDDYLMRFLMLLYYHDFVEFGFR